MSSRCFADSGGLESDDDPADEDPNNSAAAAATAYRRSVTAAAFAGSIQGSVRPPWLSTISHQLGPSQRQDAPIYVAASPPKHKPWQTPQASSTGAAAVIPKPKVKGPMAKGSSARSTDVLAVAARSTAAAVEQLAKIASENAGKPSCPVSSEDAERHKPKPSAKATSKARAQANIGATLPVLEPSDAAAPSAQYQPPAHAPQKPVTFAGRYPPSQPDRRVAWMNMVKDYEEKKEEDKKNCIKRQMSQEKWYNLNAEQYGLKVRRTCAVMRRPSAHFVSPPGDGQSPVRSKKEEEEEGEEEEEEGEEADGEGEAEEEEEEDADEEEPTFAEEEELE